MAVKLDNHPSARPQSGLEVAEAVFELLVEGVHTRFIALFHTVDTAYVGPIRSVRPTDARLLKPLGAPMQISGGQGWIRSLVADEGVDLITEASGGSSTFRISGRGAPHNLYGDTTEMRDRADSLGFSDAAPPQPMFVFGEPSPATGAASEILLDWANRNAVEWVYDGERYLRYQRGEVHKWVDEGDDGGQIAFDTLVVLMAQRYTEQKPPGVCCQSVPAFETVGSGDALAFFGGRVAEGTWSRESREEPFTLTLGDGSALVLPAGAIWVSVFPSNRTVSWE
jgi:hypothetical protein